jgi:hypothetical protein
VAEKNSSKNKRGGGARGGARKKKSKNGVAWNSVASTCRTAATQAARFLISELMLSMGLYNSVRTEPVPYRTVESVIKKQIFGTQILLNVHKHVIKFGETCQNVRMYVCLWFNEFGWLSLRDRDYNMRTIRYVIPYVQRYSTVLYCILYVLYMLFICRDPKYQCRAITL